MITKYVAAPHNFKVWSGLSIKATYDTKGTIITEKNSIENGMELIQFFHPVPTLR